MRSISERVQYLLFLLIALPALLAFYVIAGGREANASPAQGGYLVITGPLRIEDSRMGTNNHPAGPLAIKGGVLNQIHLSLEGGLPLEVENEVSAVLLNVTVTNPASDGYLTLYPDVYNSPPNISNLNFRAGETRANFTVVPLVQGSIGSRFLNLVSNSDMDVVVDVIGYFTSSLVAAQTSGTYKSVAPFRFFDTRLESPESDFIGGYSGLIPDNAVLVADAEDALARHLITDASAIVVNLTGVQATAGTFVTAFDPDELDIPEASNINFGVGDVTANLAVVPISADGLVAFYNLKATHLVADVVGYIRDDGLIHSDGRFVPVNATRILDTRSGSGLQGDGIVIYDPGAYTFHVRGQGLVPNDSNVGSMVANVTVVSESDTFVRVWSPDEPQPVTSNINAKANTPTPNAIWSSLSSSGSATSYLNGRGRLVVDISGYFTTH